MILTHKTETNNQDEERICQLANKYHSEGYKGSAIVLRNHFQVAAARLIMSLVKFQKDFHMTVAPNDRYAVIGSRSNQKSQKFRDDIDKIVLTALNL